ncbi:MAG: PorT family protein [Cytophagaceae bacterium]|jgi:hypothetical protein|nr:PorT family protein [Cytophagaceae bacterium]
MKKQLIIEFVFLFFMGNIFAQNVRFGVRGGANLTMMPTVDKTPLSEGYNSRLASGMGIFTEIEISDVFSVRAGVEYNGQGGVKDGLQALPTMRKITEIATNMGMSMSEETQAALGAVIPMMPANYYANVKSTMRFDYVSIPILAQYNLNFGSSPWGIYINGGPCVSFIVSAMQITEGTSSVYVDPSGQTTIWSQIPSKDPVNIQAMIRAQVPEIADFLEKFNTFGESDITGELKSVNFGLAGNIGIRYRCRRSCFFVEAGGIYGFNTIQQDSANGTNRIGAMSVMVGYSFSMF